ncbi:MULTISPECIES: rhomboid family intramembrane serine protease [Olivibacter]|jgi:membrane associated rhomboid family serine protease|uniref:Peptidase S54, rhomboid domain n=3 Tax=Sphingobacteriaceae TaxID=84566 RepID=F4CD13_SPHS2|nr:MULTISPECIES: rhomboid family intramembrane serine protease [Olivibacter]MCL4642275.1 rhomboid family intramembrane serine protease [Olivibacter sp. UJ_SKK_5.1]MDM8177689.1 rhomboid family intramembrane serine protease [Olivibacter sp. 47]MDX3911916.1 rhomboid family intramembrane serine protease [Pseudosphingobacterium sp.]QEK99662.1 rhomboid family intramembrane serine protease [Olivibacter sp. LS-1]
MESYITETPVASLIFVFTLITSIYAFSNHGVLEKFMLHPYSISRGARIYTLLTSGMIHRDWMHLFFNMFTFSFFGFQLEKILVSISSWGHVQFALIYLLSLVISDITTIMKQKNNYNYYSLGASGAICGVLFSAILFQPTSYIGVFFIPIPAVIFGPLFLFYCVWAAKVGRDSINHDAHFYGAIVGLVVTVLLYPQVIGHFFSAVGQLFT